METIQTEVYSPLGHQIGLMTGLGKLLLAVVADAEVELALDAHLCEPQLTGIATQSVVGREHIGGVQGRNRQLPAMEVGGKQPVRVVLVGTAPQPAHFVDLAGQPEPGADAGQRRHVGGDLHLDVQRHDAIGIKAVVPAGQYLQLVGHEVAMTHRDETLSRARLQAEAAVLQIIEPGLLPAGNPGIGIRVIRLAGADVVVKRRPVEVIGDDVTQLFTALLLPTADTAAGLVQPPLAARSTHQPVVRLLAQGGGSPGNGHGQRSRQHALLARHLVTRPGPGRGGGLHYGQIQPGEGARGKAGQPLQQGQRCPFLRRERERALALAQHHSVLQQLPAQHFVVRGAEQVFAMDLHRQRLLAYQGQHERLLGPLGLEQGGMRRAIGEQQAVAAELAIVGKIAEITTIGPEMAAIIGLLV
ncbi:hypothetical protein D3C80_666470 [compost metagenome]